MACVAIDVNTAESRNHYHFEVAPLAQFISALFYTDIERLEQLFDPKLPSNRIRLY